MSSQTTVLVAGATGMLGTKIVNALIEKGTTIVKAIIRPGSNLKAENRDQIEAMKAKGVIILEADLMVSETLPAICSGVDVIVSAVGNNQFTVPSQKNLIKVAEMAGVKRFIPSDYSVDYRKLDWGDNHNLDMRKEVFQALETSSVNYTLVLNGAFLETILSPFFQVFDLEAGTFSYWGDGDTLFDTTTTDDTARYVAEVVTDEGMTNQALQVAGDVLTFKQLLAIYEEVAGQKLTPQCLGSVADLKTWIERKIPEAQSPWEYLPQQYQYAMVSGKGKLDPIQNDRYPQIQPLTVAQYLQQHS